MSKNANVLFNKLRREDDFTVATQYTFLVIFLYNIIQCSYVQMEIYLFLLIYF